VHQWVARTSGVEVRGPSRLRRPFLSDRYFFVTVRLLKGRALLRDADFRLLALALNRARRQRRFYLTAWVFLLDHWHAICVPAHPLTISQVLKSVKISSTILINRRRARRGELWQARFFDRALRTVKEYNDKVEYIHLNPVKAGLVRRPEDWPWSNVQEYSGSLQEEATRHPFLPIDRVLLPSDERTRI
jgi:REP-associated tyrosine transposase